MMSSNHLRPSKVIDCGTSEKAACDFISAVWPVYTNCGHNFILLHFGDAATKIAALPHPILFHSNLKVLPLY